MSEAARSHRYKSLPGDSLRRGATVAVSELADSRTGIRRASHVATGGGVRDEWRQQRLAVPFLCVARVQ